MFNIKNTVNNEVADSGHNDSTKPSLSRITVVDIDHISLTTGGVAASA